MLNWLKLKLFCKKTKTNLSTSPAEGDVYFTTKLQNYTAVERDEVKLVCELSKATADVKWYKDGKEITPSKNIAINTDGRKRILTVRRAEKTNIGEYACDCGSDKTTAHLNIEGKDLRPKINTGTLVLFKVQIQKFSPFFLVRFRARHQSGASTLQRGGH